MESDESEGDAVGAASRPAQPPSIKTMINMQQICLIRVFVVNIVISPETQPLYSISITCKAIEFVAFFIVYVDAFPMYFYSMRCPISMQM